MQAKIAGYVQDQPVADGADVEKDALLYHIDPRDYQAALDQAKAQFQRDVAALEYATRAVAARHRTGQDRRSCQGYCSISATVR